MERFKTGNQFLFSHLALFLKKLSPRLAFSYAYSVVLTHSIFNTNDAISIASNKGIVR
ncbi:hypothetical protein [Vibrio cyclitrophicus]|mgnify:CR=1 FL=1|uniref:hypothetical protein n=1 Tax=Vibrio cyclitrophicus TaxID=47951 RepID=UPI0012FFF626|nr:hypothetical protein [Vibrio cyclitrophicus]